MSELYISIDVESDGPIPGINSMLSLGAAAFRIDGSSGYEMIGTHLVNLELLPGAVGDPATMKWWRTQKDAWNAHRVDIVEPSVAIPKFTEWVSSLTKKGEKPVCVAYPAGFDWTYVYWYVMKFVGESPFSFSCIDIKSAAMVALGGIDYRATTKKVMPKRWHSAHPHTHVAVDDAIEQGELFCNMMLDVRKR